MFSTPLAGAETSVRHRAGSPPNLPLCSMVKLLPARGPDGKASPVDRPFPVARYTGNTSPIDLSSGFMGATPHCSEDFNDDDDS